MFKECNPVQERTILSYFSDRFGIKPSVFGTYALYCRGTSIYLGPKTSIDSSFSIGILLAILKKPFIPSHSAISLFGNHATKNVITLDKNDLTRFINGEIITVDALTKFDTGYVIVQYAHFSVTCGLYKKGTLKLAFPFAMHEKLKYL